MIGLTRPKRLGQTWHCLVCPDMPTGPDTACLCKGRSAQQHGGVSYPRQGLRSAAPITLSCSKPNQKWDSLNLAKSCPLTQGFGRDYGTIWAGERKKWHFFGSKSLFISRDSINEPVPFFVQREPPKRESENLQSQIKKNGETVQFLANFVGKFCRLLVSVFRRELMQQFVWCVVGSVIWTHWERIWYNNSLVDKLVLGMFGIQKHDNCQSFSAFLHYFVDFSEHCFSIMDVFLMVRRKKTTIFLDAKETTTVVSSLSSSWW